MSSLSPSAPAARGFALRLSGRDVALFASDVHLGDHDAQTARLFIGEVAREGAQATHLFLLGDVFEAWIGDDAPDDQAAALVDALRTLRSRGTLVYAMRGNRDFLLGTSTGDGGAAPRTYPSQAPVLTLLEDPSRIDLFGIPALLMHGDTLCTDDTEYQSFRSLTRTSKWQLDFLSQPIAMRQAIARELRGQSERAKGAKTLELMDVNRDACVRAALDEQVALVIHGHTHRPAHHLGPPERWVLPDWDAARGRGGFLRFDRTGARRLGAWAERPVDAA
jgi:UDP-2,3-diacylglucosamine hydrolase